MYGRNMVRARKARYKSPGGAASGSLLSKVLPRILFGFTLALDTRESLKLCEEDQATFPQDRIDKHMVKDGP